MKVQKKNVWQKQQEDRLSEVWHILKTFRNSGRHWVQLQKFHIRGIEGVVAIDQFHAMNLEFEPLEPEEILAALIFKRGLFFTAVDRRSPEYRRERLVTDWVTTKDDLRSIEAKLAAYFDLTALLAVDGKDPINGSPRLLETNLLPGCHKDTFYDSIASVCPEAKTFECRVGDKQGLRKMIDRLYTPPKNGYAHAVKNGELPWHQSNGQRVVSLMETLAIHTYFQELLHQFHRDLRNIRWNTPSPQKALREAVREQFAAIGCEEYADEMTAAITGKQRDQILKNVSGRGDHVITVNGKKELARVV